MKNGLKYKSVVTAVRWSILVLLFSFILLCRYVPSLAENYARNVYPSVSYGLSAFSSLFSFPLEEILVMGMIGWVIAYPIFGRRNGRTWKTIMKREMEVFLWIYVWFYLAWGLNYFRYGIYTRLQVNPVSYDEQQFQSFLHSYTDSLNTWYTAQVDIPSDVIEREVKLFYRQLPSSCGLSVPEDFQNPKYFIFTSLYSKVGVLGSMGPFFAEAQLNADILPLQLPFTYAHEFSHLLGVSNEAEANYWAYRVCTESSVPAMKYSGYFGLLPYVLINAKNLLEKETYERWIRTIRPEVIKDYTTKRTYWQNRYSPRVGQVQDYVYNLFLKGNRIPSGKKNYAEVIGILLSMK